MVNPLRARHQQRHNKALHPTTYSLRFGRKLPSLRLPAAGELGVVLLARGSNVCDSLYIMGWDADATRNGKVIQDWNQPPGVKIVDPILRAAFGNAVEELKKITGHGDAYFIDGGLHGHASLHVLQLATGEPCVRNYIMWGQLEWTEELIQRLNLTANWMIPKDSGHSEEYCWVPEAYEERDYWCVKLFWDVCVEHHLGILLSW